MNKTELGVFVQKIESIDLDHVGFKFSHVADPSFILKNRIKLIHFKSPFRKMTLYFQLCAYLENANDPIESARGYSLNAEISKIDEYDMDLGSYTRKHHLPLAQLNNGNVVGNQDHIDAYLREFEVASRTYLFDFLMGVRYEATPDPRDL